MSERRSIVVGGRSSDGNGRADGRTHGGESEQQTEIDRQRTKRDREGKRLEGRDGRREGGRYAHALATPPAEAARWDWESSASVRPPPPHCRSVLRPWAGFSRRKRGGKRRREREREPAPLLLRLLSFVRQRPEERESLRWNVRARARALLPLPVAGYARAEDGFGLSVRPAGRSVGRPEQCEWRPPFFMLSLSLSLLFPSPSFTYVLVRLAADVSLSAGARSLSQPSLSLSPFLLLARSRSVGKHGSRVRERRRRANETRQNTACLAALFRLG